MPNQQCSTTTLPARIASKPFVADVLNEYATATRKFPKRQVLHKQIYRRNAFGGTTNTTLCGRVKLGVEGANSADTDAEVTCKFCLHKMHLPPNARNQR